MSYSLFWRSPALPFVQKQTSITVPAGAVVSNASSLRFTGKGATNYGKIGQENLMRLLENFAGPTEPAYPTVGQTWFDTTTATLKVCVATPPVSVSATGDWEQINTTQITPPGGLPPLNPQLGDTWFSQTGTSSGVLYVYTGVGRYPEQDWDAATAGYWPAPSTTLGAIMNSGVFGPPNTNYNEAYIHGYSSSTPADVPGTIVLNSVVTAAPNAVLATNFPVIDGLIVLDQSATMVGIGGQSYFVVHQTLDNRWFYDNNTALVEFTPAANMFAIGRCTVGVMDNAVAPGISSIEIWGTGVSLTNMKQVQNTVTAGAIGGWEQIWPQVETHGGRDEWEYVYGLVASLIGHPIMFGGSSAEGRAIQYLPPFKSLDASMGLAWASRIPQDLNVSTPAIGRNTLRVDPNSADWDLLLSAARYAVSRVEVPGEFALDLSPYPFVQDGRIIPSFLHALPSTDIRRPPPERYNRQRVGSLTLHAGYQETVNVLRAAVANRYLMRGILEASGTGNTFLPTVSTFAQASFSALGSALGTTTTHGLRFQFAYTNPSLEEFFFGANALQLLMTHTPSGSPTAADITLQTLTSAGGRVRCTADNTLVMSPAPSATLAQAPSGVGFVNYTGPGVVLATLVSGGSTVVVRGLKTAANAVLVYIDITPGGACTGTFTVQWSYLRDAEVYNGSNPVYPAPLAYVVADKGGSPVFA